MDGLESFQDADLFGAMEQVIPPPSRRLDRRTAASADDPYGYSDYRRRDFQVGRPLYPIETFTANPVLRAREQTDYGKQLERAEAAAQLRAEDLRGELLLGIREELYHELNRRRQRELDDLKLSRRNRVLNDSAAFIADFHDMEEQLGENGMTWEGILNLQRKHPGFRHDPDAVDLVSGYKHLEDDYNERMAQAKAEREAAAKANYDASMAAQVLDPRQREVYDLQMSRGVTPLQGVAAVGRSQQYQTDYDNLVKSGVSPQVLDNITVGNLETMESGFDPTLLRGVQADLATISRADKVIADNAKRIEEIEKSRETNVTGTKAPLTEDERKLLANLKKSSAEAAVNQAEASRRLRGSTPETNSQVEAADFARRILGNDQQPQPQEAQPPSARPTPTPPPNPIRDAVGG